MGSQSCILFDIFQKNQDFVFSMERKVIWYEGIFDIWNTFWMTSTLSLSIEYGRHKKISSRKKYFSIHFGAWREQKRLNMFLRISSIVDTCNICEKGTQTWTKRTIITINPESKKGPKFWFKTCQCQRQNLLMQKYLQS